MTRASLLAVVLLAGCASPRPDPGAPPAERYEDAYLEFDIQSGAMLRAAGRNRLRVESSAEKARAALAAMIELIPGEAEGGKKARLSEIDQRFAGLARAIAAQNAVSSGQELAVGSLRDEVARDYRLDPKTWASAQPAPGPASPLSAWEQLHRDFAIHARGGEAARLVQDYSLVKDALEALASTEEDRYRVKRFLREYERLAELVRSGTATEQDLNGLPVLEADIRAAFGGEK